jgi:SAM-dependent methyltransferase
VTATAYYARGDLVRLPSPVKRLSSWLFFPLLAVLSREQSLRLGLVPIDDERVIACLRHARGRVLDVGCGGNLFVRSYGDGVGVDVFGWSGCDQVIKDAAELPFEDASFATVSFLACVNHIWNREAALGEASRVLAPGGRLLVTMIPPKLGRFVHWLRRSHDPDQCERHLDHSHELLGMSAAEVTTLMRSAGFGRVSRKRFAFGTNSLFIGERA